MSVNAKGSGAPAAGLPKHAPKCVHFNGIQHDTCKAGVVYLSVRDSGVSPYRWPCLDWDGKKANTTCAKYRALTEEEWAEHDRRIDAAINRITERMKAAQCIQCGVAITGKQIVGHCLYVEPCGHRQGQVATNENPDAAPAAPKEPQP